MGGGLDTDAGHRGQDPGKRVCIKYPLNLLGTLFPLLENGFQAVRQARQDGVGGGGARDGDRLLAEGGHDRLDQLVAEAGRVDFRDGGEFVAASLGDAGRSAATRECLQDGRVADLRADGVFESGVDPGEQPADPIGDAGGFVGQVVVEPDQHLQLGQRLVTDIHRAQRVRQATGRVGDNERVPGIGLGPARVEVGDTAHRQAGQVSHPVTGGAGDRYRQRPIVAGWSTTTSSVV